MGSYPTISPLPRLAPRRFAFCCTVRRRQLTPTAQKLALPAEVSIKSDVSIGPMSGKPGHPAADVVERYRERGTTPIDTVHCGAWTLESASGASAPAGECERAVRRRYWQHASAPGGPASTPSR